MCYYLYVASPLTLSEIRSMLAPGLSAELLERTEARALLQHHPDAQTAARLIHGACSCDLVRFRQPVSREDEAHLRTRYRRMAESRQKKKPPRPSSPISGGHHPPGAGQCQRAEGEAKENAEQHPDPVRAGGASLAGLRSDQVFCRMSTRIAAWGTTR